MNQHLASTDLIIFVTHVEANDIYLKIWGQLDKQAATCVERFIHPLVPQFSQGYGCPSSLNKVPIGALCCAKFQTDGYYRARILNVQPNGTIVVHFVDYGNIEVLQPNEIHLLENIPGSELLQSYPPVAHECILVDVLPKNGIWEDAVIDAIKKTLCYNEYRASIHSMIANHYVIRLWYNDEDFSQILVREQWAVPASIQDMLRYITVYICFYIILLSEMINLLKILCLSFYCRSIRFKLKNKYLLFRLKRTWQCQMSGYPQQNQNINNFTTMPIAQNFNINQNVSMRERFHKSPSPGMNQQRHTLQMVPVQEALVFKSRVLDVGSKHEVMVSYVEDGPQKFSIQIQSTTDTLSHLMNEINKHPKKPLQEPPLPGSVCLGRYNIDKVLCRAVVMSVTEHKCKLYYVDFGHTEVLPYTDIFQLPPEYIKPKVLSIRFTLSGLKELNITPEMKEYFKKLVSRKLLVLHVRPPEGPPLIQYGDLYDNGINIKDMLKKTFPAPTAVAVTYSYPQLGRLLQGIQEIVYVGSVESYNKFFVQLDSGIKSLKSLMIGLEQYAKTAPTLDMAQLETGLPCAALCNSQW